jgi:hypothetical protein
MSMNYDNDINDDRMLSITMTRKILSAKSDLYSMSLQLNIIAAVAECKFIFVIDVAAFFYQFRVRSKNRHKLIVVSHREQEYFFVAFMSFKNSFVYAQRRINIILRDIKHFCRAFIDDIIIFSNTLKEHFDHFLKIFQLLLNNDIKLNSCKSFLSFSLIALLEQHVDDLSCTLLRTESLSYLIENFQLHSKS